MHDMEGKMTLLSTKFEVFSSKSAAHFTHYSQVLTRKGRTAI